MSYFILLWWINLHSWMLTKSSWEFSATYLCKCFYLQIFCTVFCRHFIEYFNQLFLYRQCVSFYLALWRPLISCRSGQFVSQFPTEASVLSQSSSAIATQPSMMALQQPLSTAYYDPTQQLQPGMTHVALPHVGDQPHITHSTRAHPQTVR